MMGLTFPLRECAAIPVAPACTEKDLEERLSKITELSTRQFLRREKKTLKDYDSHFISVYGNTQHLHQSGCTQENCPVCMHPTNNAKVMDAVGRALCETLPQGTEAVVDVEFFFDVTVFPDPKLRAERQRYFSERFDYQLTARALVPKSFD